MNWLAWTSLPWRGSTTASSLVPLPPGPTPSAYRSSARQRFSTRSPNSQRNGWHASPRRSRTAGRSTRTSSWARATAESQSRPSRVSTGHLADAFCGTTSLHAAAPSSNSTCARSLPRAVCDELVDNRATALLLLVGHPAPAVSIVKSVRRDQRLAEIMIGAPAGQPEFPEWATLLGNDGAGIPFLRYLPERLSPLGARVETALRERLGEAPSFVAFEGYDTVAVLTDVLRSHGADRARIAGSWPRVAVEGTRGQIQFSRTPGISVWQWVWPPVQVVDPDPAEPDRFRILQAG